MKKLSSLFPWLALIFCVGFTSSKLKVYKQELVNYPTCGTFKLKPSSFPEFKEIDFWVHDAAGKEIYYANHAIGISAPKEHIQLYADKEYISHMIKNANQIYLKKR